MAAQTAAAVGRALLIALAAVAISGGLRPWLASLSGRTRLIAWALLLAPFFTPPLLISYAFARFAQSLVVSPWSHEALYIGVLALKLIPAAVILRLHLPSPLSPEAWHIYRTRSAADCWRQLLFRLRGAGEGPWIAGSLVFLLAFADFELASLWSIHTWTIAVFDAQIGGLALSHTLRLITGPLAVAAVVIAWSTLRARNLPFTMVATRSHGERWPWAYLGASAFLVTIVPLALVSGQALSGISSLAQNFVLGPEIGASLVTAASAMLLADIVVRLVWPRRGTRLLVALPGLLGALTLSLFILALFQIPGLHALYNTPLPLILALALLIFPLALLLRMMRPQHTPALHIARQLRHPRLLWELQTRPHLIACGLLFCWAYYDFTTASILAPVGFTPVFVRLHNLAHYGQNAVLSAMMLAAFATPVLVLLLTATALHLYARRDGR